MWGVRAGALLVGPSLTTCDVTAGVLLWQPVLSGSVQLNQFLRLRVTAEMMAAGSERGGTRRLKDRLAAGETLEIAGYRLSPSLAAGLDAARFDPARERVRSLVWLEVSSAEPVALAPASRSRIDELQREGFTRYGATRSSVPLSGRRSRSRSVPRSSSDPSAASGMPNVSCARDPLLL